jgi:hypothetical protein
MRKIEQQMMWAIRNRKNWHSNNTVVCPINEEDCAVFLHGNRIAEINSKTGAIVVNVDTLRTWATNTTKSRLRALGANVSTRKGVTYLNNVAI